MAASTSAETPVTVELAMLALEAEFIKKKLPVPRELMELLQRFTYEDDETPKDGRRRLFKRIFGILWFGKTHVGLGKFSGNGFPTYVYPQALRDVVRALTPANLHVHPDPKTAKTYHVTMEDLASAIWPPAPKAKPRKQKKKTTK